MFHFLSTTISQTTPKLHFLHNHPYLWLSLRFMCITSKSKGHSFTVSYLINTCGFSPQQAVSASKLVNFETREKPDSVIQFFINHGLSQSKALSIIRAHPKFLHADALKTLQPKIDFFKSKGFSNSDMLNIISGFPTILRRSLDREIIPSFDLLNTMFDSKHKFMKAIVRNSGILCDLGNYLVPNIKLLRDEGVPQSNIVRLMEYSVRAFKTPPKRFKEVVDELKELEFDPLKLHFVEALSVKRRISKSTWAKKEGMYRRWGWTDDDIRAAFRAHPHCMAKSGNKIDKVMDFLLNKLGCKSSAIARRPVVLTLSLEKRIIPRGSVILVLLSKGLVNKLSLSPIFVSVEREFLSKYVFCHEKEADELLKLYKAELALAG